jgi:hypothetical protein
MASRGSSIAAATSASATTRHCGHCPSPSARSWSSPTPAPNATAIGYLLGIPPVPWEWERFASAHTAVSALDPIEVGGQYAYSLTLMADVAHLPPGLITR